jgi:mannose-6-phosphate isomerase-like protein (cupin superfamily)
MAAITIDWYGWIHVRQYFALRDLQIRLSKSLLSPKLDGVAITMKMSRKDAVIRKIDDTLTIESLFDGKGFKFDVVIAKLNGRHPKLINHVSDRAYFVLSGALDVQVGEETHHTVAHDLVLVPANTPHGIDGEGEYLIITSPPFDPQNEEIV